jgi:hypothetical protein
MSGWPSGLRRQTQGIMPCSLVGSKSEHSGPLMRAGVQIPFLTNLFIYVSELFDCILLALVVFLDKLLLTYLQENGAIAV